MRAQRITRQMGLQIPQGTRGGHEPGTLCTMDSSSLGTHCDRAGHNQYHAAAAAQRQQGMIALSAIRDKIC